jgi:hypothetical protein
MLTEYKRKSPAVKPGLRLPKWKLFDFPRRTFGEEDAHGKRAE